MSVYLFTTSTTSYSGVTSVKSLEFTFLKPKIDFSKYDYLIITSKQIAKALLAYKEEGYIEKKALCVSSKSADAYRRVGASVLEVADGYGDTLVESIKSYPKESRWLYLRGEQVASSFAQECRDSGYLIDETILYKSECSSDIGEVEVEKNATLIFTSPSSVECFLKVWKFEDSHSVVVIGKTTAKALPMDMDYKIAKKTTIESCLELL